MSCHAHGLRGQMGEGWAACTGGMRRAQTGCWPESMARAAAGKPTSPCRARGVAYDFTRMDGRVGTSNPAAERRDGL